MVDYPKTSYRLEIGLKYDAIPISAVNRLVRESVGPERQFLTVGKDQQSGETWLWKGKGTEEFPYCWIKISPSRIFVFSGFYSGWKTWQDFRQKSATALANFLPEVTPDSLAHVNMAFLWQVKPDEIKSPEVASSGLLPFSQKFLPADLASIDRFEILLYNEEKKRASLDMYMDETSKEIQFFAVIQNGKFDKNKTVLQIIEQVFEETDPDFLKANSSVLEIIG
jgi:hypothetical protein